MPKSELTTLKTRFAFNWVTAQFKLNSVYAVELQCSKLCVYGCLFGQLFFVVEYLATQTGGATVNNIFEVILVEYLATI